MYKELWAIIARIDSTEAARNAMNRLKHSKGINNYTYLKMVQAIEQQYIRYRGE